MMKEVLRSRVFFEEGHLPLCVFRMPYVEWGRRVHAHDFHEVMIVIGGVAVHHMNDRHETVSMGDVFVIPPGYQHSYEVAEHSGVEVLNVLFDWKRLNMNLRDLESIPDFHTLFSFKKTRRFEPHLKLSAKELAHLNAIIEEIETELEGMAPGCEFLCEAKFREMIVFLARRHAHVADSSGPDHMKLSAVITYMEKHLTENLNFKHLAGCTQMSATSLRRHFQDILGCSPMAYLRRMRIRRAMLLLSDPRKSISDVAFEVGFNDSGYFARIFKREAGMSPRAFREQL